MFHCAAFVVSVTLGRNSLVVSAWMFIASVRTFEAFRHSLIMASLFPSLVLHKTSSSSSSFFPVIHCVYNEWHCLLTAHRSKGKCINVYVCSYWLTLTSTLQLCLAFVRSLAFVGGGGGVDYMASKLNHNNERNGEIVCPEIVVYLCVHCVCFVISFVSFYSVIVVDFLYAWNALKLKIYPPFFL